MASEKVQALPKGPLDNLPSLRPRSSNLLMGPAKSAKRYQASPWYHLSESKCAHFQDGPPNADSHPSCSFPVTEGCVEAVRRDSGVQVVHVGDIPMDFLQ